MDARKFWLVWNPMSPTPPSYRHESFDSAVEEAKRLAKNFDGQQFFVLSADAVAQKTDVVVRYFAQRPYPEELPF